MKVRPVVHFEIRAREPDRLRTFYAELFNWQIESREGMPVAFIGAGEGGPEQGVGGAIVPSAAPGFSIYVQVADLKESLRKAEELGGAAAAQPLDVPGGPTIAQIRDPEGNLVGLVQQ
jgi:predicted enzyme related to lactoylglutathione lyase